MATTGKRQKKSEFLRDLFRTDPNVSEKNAVAAWKREGHEGTISSSSYFTAKKKAVGETRVPAASAERTKPKSTKGPKGRRKLEPVHASSGESNGQSPVPEKAKSGDRGGVQDRRRRLDAVEGGIDDLIFALKEMGGVPEVEEALRTARRLLYRI